MCGWLFRTATAFRSVTPISSLAQKARENACSRDSPGRARRQILAKAGRHIARLTPEAKTLEAPAQPVGQGAVRVEADLVAGCGFAFHLLTTEGKEMMLLHRAK